jgi:hypothetical protein
MCTRKVQFFADGFCGHSTVTTSWACGRPDCRGVRNAYDYDNKLPGKCTDCQNCEDQERARARRFHKKRK